MLSVSQTRSDSGTTLTLAYSNLNSVMHGICGHRLLVIIAIIQVAWATLEQSLHLSRSLSSDYVRTTGNSGFRCSRQSRLRVV